MNFLKSGIIVITMLLSSLAFSSEENALPALRGFDPISYHTIGRPVMGNGNFVSGHKGQHYLFISKSNKKKFDKNPNKYAPAFGGWCAFGVAVNKKFHADPLVWEIVNGKLYVNLDNKIKGMWIKDIPGNISKANKAWKEIKSKSMSSL